MFEWEKGCGYTYLLKAFLHGANDIHTKVEWTFCDTTSFQNNDVITPYIIPHEQCDCVEVLHPEKFRLRMRTLVQHEYSPQVGLYISCEPAVPIIYKVEGEYAERCRRDTVHTDHIGWQYLTSVLWNESEPEDILVQEDILKKPAISLLTIKLYIDKKPKISASSASEHSLSSNLSQSLTDGTYSDITLSSQDGVMFKAHRFILAKRSAVLQANFEHNADKNVITTTLKEDILSQMLTYIYTDNTPEPGNVTGDLLMAADYYQLPGLKTICAAALCNHLTVDNSVATLEIAVKFNCLDMIKFIVDYIQRNLKLVTKTKDYKNITSVDVMKVLFENGMKIQVSKEN